MVKNPAKQEVQNQIEEERKWWAMATNLKMVSSWPFYALYSDVSGLPARKKNDG